MLIRRRRRQLFPNSDTRSINARDAYESWGLGRLALGRDLDPAATAAARKRERELEKVRPTMWEVVGEEKGPELYEEKDGWPGSVSAAFHPLGARFGRSD